ncbi:MAG: DUF4364 family protein [Oscillospiraceae bacterium]|nr:DUF4364 family protein [Oscillospiraceae bacterium]
MQVPRIRIDEIDDICVLICHLIYSLGCPLSKEQLAEITSFEDAVNYFDLTQALEKISGHLCDEADIDGETVYSNTPMGIKAARELGAALPLSVRDKMFKEAVRVYTRDAMKKKGSFLAVRYIKNADESCTVGITVMDEDTAQQKYYMEIAAENTEQADKIKQKIKVDPKGFARYLDGYFNK